MSLALGLFGVALYLCVKRPMITGVHLTAFFLLGVVAALAGALLLQVAYKPPHIYSGWKSPAPPSERNSLGFRGRPIEYGCQDRVVVLLGDSHVEAAALPFSSIPERLLESYLSALSLPTKVFTVGTWGYGQDQELLALMEYYQKHRADLVVLWQTPGNDVWNNMFSTHLYSCSPKPTYWLENGALRGPSERPGQVLADSPVAMVTVWKRVLILLRREGNWERKLPTPYSPASRYAGPISTQWQERWDKNIGRMRDENFATEKNHMALMLTPRSQRTDYGIQLTHALIDRIEDLVTANRGRFVLFQVSVSPPTTDDGVYALNGKYYQVSNQQLEVNLREINAGFETEIIPVMVRDWKVGPEDSHLNVAANQQVLGDLAKRLQRRLVEPKSESFQESPAF